MIGRLAISRFKSIRELTLQCRKVNVFVGAPDTGKTNILDALQLLSRLGFGWPLDQSLRLTKQGGFDALFYRQFFDRPFRIVLDDWEVTAKREGTDGILRLEHPGGSGATRFGARLHLPNLDWIRAYAFRGPEEWTYESKFHRGTEIVATPHGQNLTYIARHNEKVYDFLKETIAETGWKLRFDQASKRFVMSDVREDDIFDYNLELLSDSLKRFFFYGSVLLTSSGSTLVFDEPDVYAFPPYPKLLGEMIAADAENQFFVTTHNPYFLAALAEKTPSESLAIFVCRREADAGTQAHLLGPEQVSEVIERGANVFFDLERLIEPSVQ